MKLSVIIPVYRTEATLDRCMESVLGQTFGDMEVILVDDGSPDLCPALCDDWAGRDARVRVIHQLNGGLSQARNAGLDVAQGEWVTFVDSDDHLERDTYAQVMDVADGADMVEFPLWRFYGSQRQQRVSWTVADYTDMGLYWLQARGYEHCYAWNKVFRRELFQGVRFPAGRVFEDVATLPLLLARACCVRMTDKGLYYYCDNPKGITAQATGHELEQLLEAHLGVVPKWLDDRYYMHVANIQLDVCRLTGQEPRLPRRRVSPLAAGLTMAERLKAIVINIFGMKALCHLNRTIRNH